MVLQEDTFRIMQVEKLIAYLFLSFILLVACFNIIDTYPVSVHATDILLIFATVLAAGFLAVWLPVRRMTRNL